MRFFDEMLDFDMICDGQFKEDSVREEIIVPILKKLGYSAFGQNKIIRSKVLEHPYIYCGTAKRHIKMIPDYLLQVEEKNAFILDAKAPGENIRAGKNVEQAYSYAIHRDVKVNIFALCNGVELSIFNTDELEPYIFKINELEYRWEDVYKLLSPLGFINSQIFNYKPDLGLKLLGIGMHQQEIYFMGTYPNVLAKINDNTYSFSSVITFEEKECFATFDFDNLLLDDFIKQIPDNKKESVSKAISNLPFKVHFEAEEESFKVMFKAKLGEVIYNNSSERYIPLKVVSFLDT